MALHPGMATHHLRGVFGLELQKVRAINQAGDDLAHVVGLALVRRHDAHQFLFIKQRLGMAGGSGCDVPAQLVHHLARHGNGVGIVLTQVLAQPGDPGMGLGTAQLVFRAVLANGGLHQRWASQKDIGTTPHQNHIVRQARQISTTRSGRAMHHRNLRQTHGRHARLVGKGATAFNKNFALVHQIGATTLHQRDQRQLVLLCDLLHAQTFFQTHGRHGAALDRTVAGRNDAAFTRHYANADDRAAPHDRLLAIVVVHVQPGQAADLQERCAAVQQAGHALTRQQLLALFKLVAFGFGLGNDQPLQALDFGQQALHALGIGGKGVGCGLDLGTDCRHQG